MAWEALVKMGVGHQAKVKSLARDNRKVAVGGLLGYAAQGDSQEWGSDEK